ncbi:hypothetical protein [Marinovum algicola]|uniref:hypothetical protein n=1 Tax=Marinovum algicola TaxID=42444 RepID=UPI003B518E4A
MVAIATSTIVSQAFRHLEHPPVAGLAETHPLAVAAAEQYDAALDLALSMYDWSFARVLAALPEVGAQGLAPDTALPFAFAVPGDLVRLHHVKAGVAWRRDGEKLRADAAGPLEIRYTARLSNEAQLPVSFRDVVSLQLAIRLQVHLPTRTKRVDLREQLEVAFTLAQEVDKISASSHDFSTGEAVDHRDWAEEAQS